MLTTAFRPQPFLIEQFAEAACLIEFGCTFPELLLPKGTNAELLYTLITAGKRFQAVEVDCESATLVDYCRLFRPCSSLNQTDIDGRLLPDF